MKSNHLKNVYNTNNARGPFQLINLKWKFILKYSPVLSLHNFVEPGKTMIIVVFSLIILLYTLPTLILFLLHQTGLDIDAAKIL